MAQWNHKTKIKHLLTDSDDHAKLQASMNAIADVLTTDRAWLLFRHLERFRNVPQGDDIFSPTDYCHRLLDWMYDYANENRIWTSIRRISRSSLASISFNRCSIGFSFTAVRAADNANASTSL